MEETGILEVLPAPPLVLGQLGLGVAGVVAGKVGGGLPVAEGLHDSGARVRATRLGACSVHAAS
jgi:hypothetical protein